MRKRGTSWIAVILVIVLGSAVGIFAGSFMAVWLPMLQRNGGIAQVFEKPFGDKRFVRILMLGEDNTGIKRGGHGLSDTLVVLAIDTESKDIRAISIPRDTRVEIPGHGTCKINSANVYGGPKLAEQVIQDLIGVPIDYYIATTTSGLRGMVDLVGGVWIKVDKDMHYTDRHQGLYIDLHAGPEKQLLNAKQAEGYVRFRHDRVGDSGFEIIDGKKVPAGRTARQQIFMRALANRILALPTKRERMRILDMAFSRGYIASDLHLKDWEGFSEYFKDIDPAKVQMTVLPGAPGNMGGASYWLPDQVEVARVVSEILLFQDPPARVEVLNGSGVAGMARKVADKLQQQGFNVLRTDNAPQANYPQSCVIKHKGKEEPAKQIAALLNCNEVKEDGTQKDVDITVIVGRNYTE